MSKPKFSEEANSKNTTRSFLFEDQEVRIVDDNGDPWFVAKDVGKVLGLKRPAVTRIVNKIKDEHKGFISIDTVGGAQKTVIISEQGIYKMILQSRKPKAEKFQDWITEDILPSIRKTGGYHYSSKLTSTEILLEENIRAGNLLRALVEQERLARAHAETLRKHGESIEDHEERLESIESVSNENIKVFKFVERSQEAPIEKSVRSKINELVRAFCLATNTSYKDVWNKIYTEFKYRYRTDLKARSRKSGLKPIAIAEDLDMLDELFSVASIVCAFQN